MHFRPIFLLIGCLALACEPVHRLRQSPDRFEVIAYYAGKGDDLHRYRFERLTQVIFSFCHLRGHRLAVDDAQDSLTIRRLVALKKQHPHLKVLLSLGGWCGCEPCSEVFSTEKGRVEFASSAFDLMKTYGADGLDLDWEYPAIEGCPGHRFVPEDRPNFTALVAELRRVFGSGYQLSFAAGGFRSFFDGAVDWAQVMPLLDRVNLMSYDLVSGFSTKTGHHTPLFSTPEQESSVDFGVDYLLKLGVPRKKIVIGAAFYGRVWGEVDNRNRGLYQSGKFKDFVHYDRFAQRLSPADGFVFYRDSVAQAPWAYSPTKREFATFDDPISLAKKSRYARAAGLGGIMFWQLTGDTDAGELLKAVSEP